MMVPCLDSSRGSFRLLVNYVCEEHTLVSRRAVAVLVNDPHQERTGSISSGTYMLIRDRAASWETAEYIK